MKVALISTYDSGHSPFGLASPRAWLERDGHQVRCVDLAVEKLREEDVFDAGLIAFFLPMHTATRLAIPAIHRVKKWNPGARLACYGLYAPINADLLRSIGVHSILGGEFEPGLAQLARGGGDAPEISLERLQFIVPDRTGFSQNYARLRRNGESIPAAYTETSRGCKHRCRHCPVVPVYNGQFRIVQSEIVLEDIRRQTAAGARHVTFGDPDFFNGPTHARKIVEALHAEFPEITYDATIKIEHLLKHRDLLPVLRETGCLFVTSAVESLDDRVLATLEKNHTRRDFFEAAKLMHEIGLILQPTFLAFTPWTTMESYRDLLCSLARLDLVENVAPVQLALRLLITASSRLLELDEIRAAIGPFDPVSLVYPWKHPDPEVDALCSRVFRAVAQGQKDGRSRHEIFREVWNIAIAENFDLIPRAAIPYLDEPWYC
ncbi:MAG: CUAEP/CCAEP-tail radical SAM (seleno)protein, partial [Bryobacteraceae bacterium]